MLKWVRQLDSILRGEATRMPALREGTIDISSRGLSVVLVILGMLYGLCMGLFSVIASGGQNGQQVIATTVKVPLLFFLTLLVTFPSLYVFNALVGSRLRIHAVLRLLVAALGVMLAVLASFGTIVAFFSVSTASYHFMTLLNVVVFAASGFLGLTFLLQTLHRLSLSQEQDALVLPRQENQLPPPLPAAPQEAAATNEPAPPVEESEVIVVQKPAEEQPSTVEAHPPITQISALRLPGPLDATDGRVLGPHVKAVFRIWIIVFGLVGAQMGWVLRPFIGNPAQPFTWFRPRESNFFEAVWNTLRGLLGG